MYDGSRGRVEKGEMRDREERARGEGERRGRDEREW